jgi:hypothetical protein
MRFLPPLLVLILLAGCVQTEVTMLDDASRSPVSATEVTVYEDTSDVACSFDEIAVIRSNATMASTGEHKLIENGKKKAGAVGGNALIVRRLARAEPNSNAGKGEAQQGNLTGQFLAVFEDRPCS